MSPWGLVATSCAPDSLWTFAVPAALFGGPFLDFDLFKYCCRAIAVPAAVFWGPFLDFESPNVIFFCYRYKCVLIRDYFRLQIQILAFENYFCNRLVWNVIPPMGGGRYDRDHTQHHSGSPKRGGSPKGGWRCRPGGHASIPWWGQSKIFCSWILKSRFYLFLE